MVVRRMFDPNMLTHLADFFPSLCTIQEPVYITDPGGEKRVDHYTDFAGHVGLPCSIGIPGGGEQKLVEARPIITLHRIALRAYYPTITRVMRAVVSGQAYDILSVDHDQHRTQTYLGCEVAEL